MFLENDFKVLIIMKTFQFVQYVNQLFVSEASFYDPVLSYHKENWLESITLMQFNKMTKKLKIQTSHTFRSFSSVFIKSRKMDFVLCKKGDTLFFKHQQFGCKNSHIQKQ